MPQGPPERPGWQVRISAAVPGPDGGLVEDRVPSGGGVWVGGRWVLTCAHVLGTEPRTVMARFSFAGGEPVPATVSPQAWLAEQQDDLVLLELDWDPPPAARPAPLLPARAVTGHACAAYGYPAGFDSGVWSEPEITGQTVDRLQLTAQAAHGHQIERGFSGTGLVDTETGAVVGLVVTRDRGRDVLGGFAIPLQTVVAAFPQLGPWTGWRLGTDPHLRQHWRPRARGVYQDTTPGWYFTGRSALLGELTGWLEGGVPGQAVRVVTGPAGAGKSAVLAWLCALSDPQLRAEITAAAPATLAAGANVPSAGRVSAAVWARGLDADDAAGALASALTLPVTTEAAAEDVLAVFGDLDPVERDGLVVVLDALDEARTPRDIARQLLVPLARDLGVKVLAGTRPGRDEALLAALGERAVVYRLDDPAWFDRQDLADYAAACLRADFDPALPSGYRTDSEACRQVAAAIADAAGSNFLVAGLAARARADEQVIDVGAPGWRDGQRFPGEVGQAFDDYLARFSDDERRARDLLRAVAYAEGPGLLAGDLWVRMANALAPPRRYSTEDVAWLLDSTGGYLVESGSEHGQLVYRIFHQALIEHLRPQEKEKQAQREIASTLIEAATGTGGPDWAHAPPYIRRHLAVHAAIGGSLDDLVQDPGFLLACPPWSILRQRHSLRTSEGIAAVNALEAATNEWAQRPDSEREWWLQVWARKTGATTLADATDPQHVWPWRIHAAVWSGAVHRVIASSPSRINAVTSVTLPDGRILIASSDVEGVLRLWDLLGAEPLLEPLTPFEGGVRSLAAVPLPSGRQLLALGYQDGTVRLWDPDAAAPVAQPLTGHQGPVRSLAAVPMPNGSILVASGGEDGTVRLWDPIKSVPVGQPLAGDQGSIESLAAVPIPNGNTLITSAGGGGTVKLWDPDASAPVGEPLTGHHGRVLAVAAIPISAELTLIATTGYDGTLRLWNPVTRDQVRVIQTGHGRWVWSVAAVPMPDGTTLVATGGDDATIRLRDPWSGIAVGSPLTAEGASVWAPFSIAAISLPGRTMLAAAGGHGEGTVRLWDLAAAFPAGTGVSGHGGGVSSLAAVALESGRTLLASAGRDEMVHLWDPITGKAAGPPLKAEDGAGPAYSLAAVTGADGRTLLASGWRDGAVRLWDPNTSAAAGAPMVGHRSLVSTLAALPLRHGRPLLASGDLDGIVRLWDLTTRKATGKPYQSPGDKLCSMFAIQADGRTLLIWDHNDDERLKCVWDISKRRLIRKAPLGGNEFLIGTLTPVAGQTLLVSGDADGSVRLWDPITGTHVGPAMLGHVSWVNSAAAVTVQRGQQWLATASRDGTIRLWEPSTGAAVGEPLRGHIGFVNDMVALPTAQGHIALASAGSDNAILLWSSRVADDRNVFF